MTLTRRELLMLAAAAGLAPRAADALGKRPTSGAMPVLFVSHGAPMAAVEKDDYTAALTRFGTKTAVPKAIVVMSAHWQTRGGFLVTGSAAPPTIHDFGGFPEALYKLRYPSPGAPALAADIAKRLQLEGFAVEIDPSRGLDHGAWVPLVHTHPDAKVPVLQLSLPSPRTPADMLRAGLALAPLRREGVLLVGSGGVTHNLGDVDFAGDGKVAPWAGAFDAWVKAKLDGFDAEGLADYVQSGPNAARAHPSTEHFDPIFFALGAALEGDRITQLYEGIRFGTLSLRTFALGA
jgi:4,5-DOPA dioxygenase extradiol